MTLDALMDWLKQLITADNFYCGILDAKKDKSIGIYQGRALTYEMPVSRAKGSHTKSIKLLVHWTDSSVETEGAALEVFRTLEGARGVDVGDYVIDFVKLTHSEPIDVGQDSRGIFERVIEFEIYYQKKGA